MKLNNLEIDFKSVFKKGVKKVVEPFGVFLITGPMGSGKTYFATRFSNDFKKTYTIKTNIKSLKIPFAKIEYFDNLSDIFNDTNTYYLYIIDELGKKYTKESKQDRDFYNFLQMSRKTKRIVLLIHQEYYLVPFWLRGVANEIFTTSKVRFTPFFCTYRGTPRLNEDTKEWEVDYTYRYIYKRTKEISSYYDTFETVSTL